MERIKIKELITDSLYWDYIEIDDLIERLNELKTQGATHIEFELEYEHGESYQTIKAYGERLETYDEHNERISFIEKKLEQQKAYEIGQYEAIKKKYNLL